MLRILYHGSKLSEFRSAPLRGSEINSKYFPWNKKRRKLSEFRPKHVFDEKMLSILFAGARFFVPLIFFMTFPSVPGLGIDSSGNLGMPRKEHFLPRNNETHSESIPRNFFGTKFHCQPYFTTFEQRWASKPYIDSAKITNWQILMIIPLLQISNCLRCASPQIANPKFSWLIRKSTNIHKILHSSTTLCQYSPKSPVFLKRFFCANLN
jgi:hypothetical protein